MLSFRNLSLRRKQTLIIMLTGNVVLLLAVNPAAAADPSTLATTNKLEDMDLAALVNVVFRGPASLTEIDARRSPVSMTQLDALDVQQSGARDLNHLLELYIPNAQFIDHHFPEAHLGFRGIISDREDKYLYQINGRTMNNRMVLGADNERALPLLGDIRSVSVVRGPASATHGAGALAGVIDVETYNGLTFEGLDLNLRQGVVDRYTAAEIRYGVKLSDTSGLFIYYGVAKVLGADSDFYLGRSYAATNGLPANVAGQPSGAPMANLGEAGFGELWHKVHLSYANGPLEFWTRFVQDGGQARPNREIYTTAKPAGMSTQEWTRGRQIQNQQFTATARFKKDLSPDWNLELLESFDIWAFTDERGGVGIRPVRHADEQEMFSRAIAGWTPNEAHSLAFGLEYSHEWFHDPPQSDALDRAPVVTQRNWQTDTISSLAEHQWKINQHWTTFLSFRTDKHTYSDWLLSPRATLVFASTERDTFKLMAGESVRRGGDEELWAQWSRGKTIPDPESLLSYEFSYERKLSEHWRVSGNAFYEDYDAIGFIPSLLSSASIGKFQMAGGELQLSYLSGRTRITLSESVSKLVSASVPGTAPAAGQGITAAPYGFGNDLAHWAPFITKLTLVHDFSKKWTGNASLVYYSGFPGAQDYANYSATFATPPSATPVTDPGYSTPFGPNLSVNLGLEFRPSANWSIRVDAYNLAALADATLSKRNYYFRSSEFSEQPASLAVSVHFSF